MLDSYRCFVLLRMHSLNWDCSPFADSGIAECLIACLPPDRKMQANLYMYMQCAVQ